MQALRAGRRALFADSAVRRALLFWFSLDVLNDEKTRKWIQSMKRLMTFCQNKYLPDDLAKTAGWIKK